MSPARRFKALLFDFDETLVSEYDAADEILHEICTALTGDLTPRGDFYQSIRAAAIELLKGSPVAAAAEQLFGRTMGDWYAYELLWDDKSPTAPIHELLPEFRVAAWTRALEAGGLSGKAAAEEWAERFPAMMALRRGPYPDVEPVLETLSRRYGMAIVTNGEGSVQAMKVEASGLKKHFDHVVLCDEHLWKPDPLPFRVAMNQLGVNPEETAMIGNSFDSDIAGARNAGIYSIWVNRKGLEPNSELRPDATVQNLGQLPELLDD